ncbi:MAG: hypothetical protein AAFZ38_10595 [Myxococcota bacterium]
MKAGNEYGSIVSLQMNGDLVFELKRALGELEAVRGRRCVCYLANVIKNVPDTSIQAGDHLPFSEMVEQIPEEANDIDVFVATPGGSADQVTQFVDALRARFDTVEFLLPYKCMSAGTLWALSGERIWMDRRAFVGPLDPQVSSRDGSWVPAQSLLTLIATIQQDGDAALRQGRQPPWAMIRLLDQMDHRQIGHAINATAYVAGIAQEYLNKYKFRYWTTHSSTGEPVTDEERRNRARQVANVICSHDNWKAHGHAINRDAALRELKIKVDNIEDVDGLELAVRRLWALVYYVFEKTDATKLILSQEYTYVRNVPRAVVQGGSK